MMEAIELINRHRSNLSSDGNKLWIPVKCSCVCSVLSIVNHECAGVKNITSTII